MKSINVKRIAALTAGAVLLGASLVAAASITYGNTVIINDQGKPVVKIVVGAGAKASDGVAAANIAAVIGNLAHVSQTVSAKLVGDPTCTVSGTGTGACAVTDKKVTLEITSPGGTISGGYGFKTYMYGYVDSDVRTDDDQKGGAGETVLEIGPDQLPAFGDWKKGVATVSGLFTTKQKVTTKTERLPTFDPDYQYYTVTPSELKYIVSFEHDTYGGVPACTKTDVLENAAGYASTALMEVDCTAADTYLMDRQRLPIKFLGEEWIISSMDPIAGSIKLAKESTPAQPVRVGDNLSAGKYVVKLTSITIPSTPFPNGQAVVEVYDQNGVKVKDAVIDPAAGSTELTIGTDKLTIKIYRQAAALDPASRWSEMAIISQEIELKNNTRIDDAENKNWSVKLGWGKYVTTAGSDLVLKNITVYATSLVDLKEGSGINIIEKPALYQLYMKGQTLTDANLQQLNFKIGDRARTFYSEETSSTSADLLSSYDLVCMSSDKKAFKSDEIGGTDNRYKVCFGMAKGVPAFYDKSDKGLIVINGTAALNVPTVLTNVSGYDLMVNTGAAWTNLSTTVNGWNVTLAPILSSNANVKYTFTLGDQTATNTLYAVTASNMTQISVGALAILTGSGNNVTRIVNVNNTVASTEIPMFSNVTKVDNLALTYYMPDTAATATIKFDDSDYLINVSEVVNKTATAAVPTVNFSFKANSSALTFKSPGDSETKVKVEYYSATGSGTDREFEAGYVSQRGSKLVTRDASEIDFKMADKAGELQYYLMSTGSNVSAGTNTYTKAIGETVSVQDSSIKVADILATPGACTIAGNAVTCAASKAGMSAVLDTGETNKSVQVVYPFASTDRLVVLDSEAPTAEALICVGGQLVNTVTASAIKNTDVNIDAPGVKVVRESGNKIIVAGYTAADTTAAANEFIAALLAKA